MKRWIKIFALLAMVFGVPQQAWAAQSCLVRLAPEVEEEAAYALVERLAEYRLILVDERGNYIWPLTYDELGIYGEVTELPPRHWPEKTQFALRICYDQAHLAQFIGEMYADYLQAAHDAYFQMSYDNQVSIVPEQAGQTLEMSAIDDEIAQALAQPEPARTIMLKSKWIEPGVKKEDLAKLGINGLLGEFSTRFDGANQSRTGNIWLASSKIEGYLLQPGETFSFNEVVGPRTRERGFSEAGVIINNQHGTDVGGGVCQVATTLYNSARAAGMTIIERHSHSLMVHYVAKGRDAAVVYGEKDLRFRNDTDHAVLLKSYFAYGKLTFKIFGHLPEQGLPNAS